MSGARHVGRVAGGAESVVFLPQLDLPGVKQMPEKPAERFKVCWLSTGGLEQNAGAFGKVTLAAFS